MDKNTLLSNIKNDLLRYNNSYTVTYLEELGYIQLFSRRPGLSEMITIDATKYIFNYYLVKITYVGFHSVSLNQYYILARWKKDNFKFVKKWMN